jgi:formylmethanofuran dehydrogenase subunit C
MSGWTLTTTGRATLRLDLRGIVPEALAPLTAAEIERLPIAHGRNLVALAEFFRVAPRDDGRLVLAGDCARCDRIGWGMAGGSLQVDGDAGDHAGSTMRGGTLAIGGRAGDLAACEMRGGSLTIGGDVGDFAASTLPGSLDGMRGGTLVVRGNAGARFADRMRRGTALVFGDVGDFAASRLVAGTIAIGGRVGAHAGYAMRRGTLVFAGVAARPAPTFVPARDDVAVFWQLQARALDAFGGVFGALSKRTITRWRGDLAADGRGEWIVAG